MLVHFPICSTKPVRALDQDSAQVCSARVSDMLPAAGPVTILNWSFPRKDLSRSAQAYQLALALREEVDDLQKAGCRVIQVRSPRPAHPVLYLVHVLLASARLTRPRWLYRALIPAQ